MAEKNPVQSAERIFDILEKLAQNGAMGLTELGQELSLSKSTTHRLLNSLAVMGYVQKDEMTGKYQLTFKILEIAGKLLNRLDILSVAHKYLEHLMKETHETVHLIQSEGCNIVYIDKVESDDASSSIRMASRIGLRLPMICTAVGKALLAELPEKEVLRVWNNSTVQKYTPNTIVSLEDLLRELQDVRRQGYALDNEENELGVRCIAACVKDYTGKCVNAFSISAPISRMSDERIEELSTYVLKTRRDLSEALGYRG